MRPVILALIALVMTAAPTPLIAQPAEVDPLLQNEPEVVLPLLPDEVLESSATRFPDILESLAREAAARGDQIAAEGAFDLVFNADGFDRVTGFWTGSVLNTEVSQNLRPFNAQVFGGYRVSDGTFPIYEDINFTNTGGEFKVGALFSLLRNRDIDQRRFRVEDARLATSQASLEVTLTQVGVQLQALNAYWLWLATGRELLIYRDLLEIAQERAAGLEEQVRRGAQPDIAVTENLQNIIRREILVAEAERNFTVASNGLSFFLRTPTGDLVIPRIDRLPHRDLFEDLQTLDHFAGTDASEVLARRPELRSLRVAIERARNRVSLGENDLRPNLDLNVEVSRDVGAIAEGGESRDSTDTIIGFRFSVPLQRRDARGRLQRAEAELRAAKLRERRTEDQISIELGNILTNFDASVRLANLALSEVEQAELMVDAEQRRFALGASDFFLVNVREERAADARIRATRAEFNGRLAEASYNAATMNMRALGLGF
ncbi:MAG: TolC family protein [Pseudomonadota bacterium]